MDLAGGSRFLHGMLGRKQFSDSPALASMLTKQLSRKDVTSVYPPDGARRRVSARIEGIIVIDVQELPLV